MFFISKSHDSKKNVPKVVSLQFAHVQIDELHDVQKLLFHIIQYIVSMFLFWSSGTVRSRHP